MIIDWLSFTIEVEPAKKDGLAVEAALYLLPQRIREVNPILTKVIERMPELTTTAARRPYNLAWGNRMLTVMFNPKLPHALVEFSGKGCQWLRDNSLLAGMLAYAESRMTRLDVAQDLPDVTPREIASQGVSGRFRTRSWMSSDKGDTWYIGSQNSERMCRVYRYNEPHPRARLCRIEVVHRKQYAKILASEIINNGLDVAGRGAIMAFEFEHPEVKRIAEGGKVPETVKVDKDSAKTEFWLRAQCAPAFKRLVREGVIDNPEAWLREVFLE